MTIIAIYSSRTNRLRRIIADDAPLDDLLALHPPGTGEDVMEVIENAGTTAQQQLIDANGIVPQNDQYCAVRSRTVVHTFIGDVDCGDSAHAHAGASLVVDDRAKVGWRQLRDGTLERGLFEVKAELDIYEADLVMKKAVTVLPDRTREELDERIAATEAKLVLLRAEEALR